MVERGATALWICIVLLTSTLPVASLGSAQDIEDTGLFGEAGQAIAGVRGPVDEVVAPTSAAPAFHLQGETLRVELDRAPPGPVRHVYLVPSFGTPAFHRVPVTQGDPAPSTLWEGPYARTVVPLTATIPEDLAPGLYDIMVPGLDTARRALSVYEAWPERPRIVLVADTQTGDPRALSDGTEQATGVNPLSPHTTEPGDLHVPPDPEPFNEAMDETFGIDVLNVEIDPDERWRGYRTAIAQINELDPDLVLFSGDLNFGQLAPGSYHVEYEESWALLNGGQGMDGTRYEGFHVPTLLSPGNHDGYITNGEDGLEFWKAYFGPPAFKTTFSNVTLVSVNTYDWSEMDRLGASYAVSAWGGQVRAEQLAWLRTTLCEANGATPSPQPDAPAGIGCQGAGDERTVTFSHHSPSWVQDAWREEYGGTCEQAPCDGTPVVEQFTRGFMSFTTTGQGWTGENRLVLRDTLREFDVDLHAAGHTHRDRVARDVGDGTIVEVPQNHRDGLDITKLHRVTRDDRVTVPNQDEALDDLYHGDGPLYVETTTTASDTAQYWGYRPVTWHTSPQAFPEDALGIPPFEMGFPMTQALIDELAHDPSRWNASHAAFGLYSTPTALAGGG